MADIRGRGRRSYSGMPEILFTPGFQAQYASYVGSFYTEDLTSKTPYVLRVNCFETMICCVFQRLVKYPLVGNLLDLKAWR